jgi:hypothetical protein
VAHPVLDNFPDFAMKSQMRALKGPQAKAFCIRLWLELTIAGRSIWSDEALDRDAQLTALKWLNEIQHRVWGAHARDDDDSMSWLLDRIVAHCEESQILGGHVRIALDRSLVAITHSG